MPLPPDLPAGALRVVALGGLGEIGRNMTVFEYDGRLLIIDCGVLFPEDQHHGVDLILPDFSWLAGRLDAVDAIVLTHGHEDHIGAVPYLLRQRPGIPVVGSRLTLALVAAKLREHRLVAVTRQVREGDRVVLGSFDCEFFAVNHSIPDGLAVGVRTGAGLVLHTGDFKMDQLPLDRRITDLRGFARVGEEGVDLLLIDSTNAENPGFTLSERELTPAIDRVFASAGRRIVVASFASHIHRIQQIIDAAARHNRVVALVGRSMVRNMEIARRLGYLTVPDGMLIEAGQAKALAAEQVVLICTGSQGEPMSALSRMANRDHAISIGEGDTVLLASSLIPGNENAVNRVINGLTRLGAQVVHRGNALVHVSGHASAGELLYCYNVLQPRHVMPVHGEARHLNANARLAQAVGVAPERVLVAEDGVVVDLYDGRAAITGRVPCGYVYVDGSQIGEMESSLKDRRILAEEGFISVVAVVEAGTGKPVGQPEVHARGSIAGVGPFDDVSGLIEEALIQAASDGVTDLHELEQKIRRTVGRWVDRTHRRRPMIVPVVVTV
nr:ribonuclease J [Micromonospora tarapacensis]